MSQGILFSEPSIAETGVWCELNQEIDPSAWAFICRKIGKMSYEEFSLFDALLDAHFNAKTALKGQIEAIMGIIEGQGGDLNREDSGQNMPLVSIGPSGMGGEYQKYI